MDVNRTARFEALFDAYCADMVAYCGWRSSDPQDAVSDVFLTAWRRLDEVPDGDAARVWLYATARRVIANQRRSARRRDALHAKLAAELRPQPGEAHADVHEALAALDERDREVLLLAEWEGLSSAEIAAVLGCREVTARGRLHRARRRFRLVYDEITGRINAHA